MFRMMIVVVGLLSVGLAHAEYQGGDTIEDAFEIDALPFFASGTTVGYQHDYDLPCVENSDAPDVIYTYRPSHDGYISVDLCGSSFDTAVVVTLSNGIYATCNDDRDSGDSCHYQTSALDAVRVFDGLNYLIVVSGHGDDSAGDYNLVVRHCSGSGLDTPWYTVLEGEPDRPWWEPDWFNGGCVEGYLRTQPHPVDSANGCNAAVLGRTSRWEDDDFNIILDADIYSLEVAESERLEVSCSAAGYTGVFLFVDGANCDDGLETESVFLFDSNGVTFDIDGSMTGHRLIGVVADTYSQEGFEYLVEVSRGDELEPPYRVDLADQAVGLDHLHHQRNYVDHEMDHFTDFFDTPGACGGQSNVAHDGVLKVFLTAGQCLNVGPVDASQRGMVSGPASNICISLVSDLRLGDGSCIDSVCGHEVHHTFVAPDVGWYYVIFEFEVAPESWSLSAILEFDASTPYSPPPPPPVNDCPTTPVEVPSGNSVFTGDLTFANNQYDPGPDGCVDNAALQMTGGDVFYQIDLLAGERLECFYYRVDSWDGALYLLEDGQCIGSGEDSRSTTSLEYVALADKSLVLVCDSWGVGIKEFTLYVNRNLVTGVGNSPEVALDASIRPNPFNPNCEIELSIPTAGNSTVEIFDSTGRKVRSLWRGVVPAGLHTLSWDGRDSFGRELASGMYLVRVESAGQSHTSKMILAK